MKKFTIYNGIVHIGLKRDILGIFDICNYKYYSIDTSLLGEFITLYIQPVRPGSYTESHKAGFEYLRRNKAYEIRIAYYGIDPIIYDISRIWYDTTTEWPSSIEIVNVICSGNAYYHWDELTGTWLFSTDDRRYHTVETAWGPHTIEIKEMKKENTTMDKLVYNYCAADTIAMKDLYTHLANSLFNLKPKNMYLPKIKNVVISEPYTTIMWKDGSKTQVKCMDGDQFNPEHGLAMAVLKKLMEKPDKPNAYSKWVKQWVKQGIEAGEKQVARKNKKAEKKAEKEVCDSCSWAFDKDGNVQTGPTNIDYSNT